MKLVGIAAVALTGIAATAQAGSFEPAPAAPVVAAPVYAAPAPVADWSGPYVGLQLGYGQGDVDGDDFDGIVGGAHAGYRYDLGSWVVGGEIDYNAANMELDSGADEIDELTRLKLQAGYDLGNTLVYGTAGAAYAGTDGGLSDSGWAAGLGADFRVTDRITTGVEYLYHDFGDFDGAGDTTAHTLQLKVGYQF